MSEPPPISERDVNQVAADAVWNALSREPNTGVSIIDDDGTVVYCNDQAALLFLEPGKTPQEAMGKSLEDLYPREFAEERQRIVHRVIAEDKPILFRAIWHGHQHLSWIYPIHDEAGDPTSRVLVITRRTEGDVTQTQLGPDGYERVDADVIDLGKLDILSTRELVVMALLGQGFSLKDTAKQLHRSVRTIETQRDSVARKLHLSDRAALIELARQVGLRADDAYRTSI